MATKEISVKSPQPSQAIAVRREAMASRSHIHGRKQGWEDWSRKARGLVAPGHPRGRSEGSSGQRLC